MTFPFDFPGSDSYARRLVLSAFVALMIFSFLESAWGQGEDKPRPGGAPLAKESSDPPRRPRIGLVLSGGGARGAAHIGVLKVLEELRIPVHAISGTSMGSIVGGLYASGYSPAELEQALLSIDWGAAFLDRPPRRTLAFRRKEEDRDFFVRFQLGLKNGQIQLPRGVIKGQALVQILSTLVDDRGAPSDFDKLPIPFRCVTTDIETGEAVVFDSGDLAIALRASMSVPGVFTPVIVDGRALVDGGMVQNIPVAPCLAMGVDVIIAVDIGTALATYDDLSSLFNISNQLVNLSIEQNDRLQRELLTDRDLLIRPPLGDFSSANFEETALAIEIGETEARVRAGDLARFSVSDEEWAAYIGHQRRPSRQPNRVGEVVIENQTNLSDQVIRTRVGVHPGDPYDPKALNEGIRRLYGLGVFEYIDYSLSPDDPTELTLRAQPRELGNGFIRFGARYEDDLNGENKFDFATQFTFMPLNGYGAESRTRIQLGEQVLLQTELFQPLDPSGTFFVEPRVGYFEDTLTVFANGSALADYRLETSFTGIDVGAQLQNWGELRGGIEYTDGRLTPRQRGGFLVPFPRLSVREGNYRIRFIVDTFNEPNFPSLGQFTSNEIRFVRKNLGSENNFATYRGTGAAAFTVSNRLTFVPSLDYGAAIEGDSSVASSFSLGGFLRLSGEPRASRVGPYLFLSRILTYYSLGRRSALTSNLFLGGSLELGNVYSERSDITLANSIYGGSIFLGFETILGPGYIGYGLNEGGDSLFFVSFGPVF